MKLLLHVCCAPCLIGTSLSLAEFESESGEAAEFDCWFYNPNIHPAGEYERRLGALESYAAEKNIKLIFGEPYNPEVYFERVKGEESFPARCGNCYALRFEPAAKYAAENGYDAYSSTLLVSPYQNKELMNLQGAKYAEKYGVKFFGRDYSVRFREGQRLARSSGIYMQKYCGCLFSVNKQ